jgi:hypothetical protein
MLLMGGAMMRVHSEPDEQHMRSAAGSSEEVMHLRTEVETLKAQIEGQQTREGSHGGKR